MIYARAGVEFNLRKLERWSGLHWKAEKFAPQKVGGFRLTSAEGHAIKPGGDWRE
jgi:hypothetical protein